MKTGAFARQVPCLEPLRKCASTGFLRCVVMRYKGRSGGAQYPHLGEQSTLPEVKAHSAQWRRLGIKDDEIRYNEAAPDSDLVIQGEVMRSIDYISLFWSQEKTTMRKATLQNARQSYGLQALGLLRRYLYPSSYEDLQVLLDKYPWQRFGSSANFPAYRCVRGIHSGA